MNRRKIVSILLITLAIFILSACAETNTISKESTSDSTNENITLNVALFPYVPHPELFQKVINDKWEESHSNVKLNFQYWDCYEEKTIGDNLDVVTFDGLYLTEYASTGQLLELDSQQDDIWEFVRDGIQYDGKTYGAAQMICANLFFYRDGDTDLDNIHTVEELYDLFGENILEEAVPKDNQGLLVDLSSGTGNICFYLDAFIDAKAVYSDFKELPDLEHINEQAVEGLNEMILMEGRQLVKSDTNWAELFGQGKGRAYIGYSETMAAMKTDLSHLKVSTLSLADREDIPLFYVDIVAVNNNLSGEENTEKRKLAIELVNLMTSQDTMTEIIGGGECQYILPAGISCYDTLKEKFPIYTQLKAIAEKPNNHVFRMGADAHDYIEDAKQVLPHYLLNTN